MNKYLSFLLPDGTSLTVPSVTEKTELPAGTVCLLRIGEFVETAEFREMRQSPLPAALVQDAVFLGRAAEEDIRRRNENLEAASRAAAFFRKKVREIQQDCILTRARFSLKRERLSLIVSLPMPINVRPVCEQLEKRFQTKVEMHLLNPRDVAACMGGVGICGQKLCCALGICKSVDSKQARSFGRDLRDAAQSGICGRLCCCMCHED